MGVHHDDAIQTWHRHDMKHLSSDAFDIRPGDAPPPGSHRQIQERKADPAARKTARTEASSRYRRRGDERATFKPDIFTSGFEMHPDGIAAILHDLQLRLE